MSIAENWIGDELASRRKDLEKQANGAGSKIALITLSEVIDLLMTDKRLKMFAHDQQDFAKGLIDGLKLAKGEIDAALAANN